MSEVAITALIISASLAGTSLVFVGCTGIMRWLESDNKHRKVDLDMIAEAARTAARVASDYDNNLGVAMYDLFIAAENLKWDSKGKEAFNRELLELQEGKVSG